MNQVLDVGQEGPVSDVNVQLPGALSRYDLTRTNETVEQVVLASLNSIDLTPAEIGFPLRAATFRAVLGDADFAIQLVGETGAFKSELAALEQQHFGAGMTRLHLPGSWSSTAWHGAHAFWEWLLCRGGR